MAEQSQKLYSSRSLGKLYQRHRPGHAPGPRPLGTRLRFGWGHRDRIDRVEVRWIGGGIDVFGEVGVDRLLTLVEGTGSANE